MSLQAAVATAAAERRRSRYNTAAAAAAAATTILLPLSLSQLVYCCGAIYRVWIGDVGARARPKSFERYIAAARARLLLYWWGGLLWWWWWCEGKRERETDWFSCAPSEASAQEPRSHVCQLYTHATALRVYVCVCVYIVYRNDRWEPLQKD